MPSALRGRTRTAALCALLAAPLAAQQPTAAERQRIHAAAFDVMKVARYATLVTNGADGQPQARVVDPLVAADRTIWIATNRLTRKVEEIRRDPRVTLLFFNAAANEYVTVLGRARVVDDATTKAARWKAEWGPFYPNGYRGQDFMLFEVRPFRLEVSSPRFHLMNDPKTWRPVIIDFP